MSFNVKLFDKVVKHILEVPDRLAMGIPVAKGKNIVDENHNYETDSHNSVVLQPPCGTAGCFGGWTVLLGSPGRMRDKVSEWNDVGWNEVKENASDLLGLDYGNLRRLFHVEHWPQDFQDDWFRTKKPAVRAKILAERAAQFRAWALEEGL